LRLLNAPAIGDIAGSLYDIVHGKGERGSN
jgi:hypothetical protein